jgi:hypothetical protein
MKNLLMVMAVVLTAAVNVNAASREDFYFSNGTATTITGIYVAPHGTTELWGANCLPASLYPGQTTHLAWQSETGIPDWDVRVEYSTGVHADFYGGFDLTSVSRLVLTLSEYGTVSHLVAAR